jgi:hypothetical protein
MDAHRAGTSAESGNCVGQADSSSIAINSFPTTGFVGIREIVGQGRPFPVSKSTWWKWVKDGLAPAPVHIGGRTFWVAEEIIAFIETKKNEARIRACRKPCS